MGFDLTDQEISSLHGRALSPKNGAAYYYPGYVTVASHQGYMTHVSLLQLIRNKNQLTNANKICMLHKNKFFLKGATP